MSHNIPPVKDFFASPALSLSLAGVFRRNAAAASVVEEGDEESGGGCQGEQAGFSGDNSGPAGPSDEDQESNESLEEDRDVGNKRKRKKYHRHTAEQIREMEVLFKESPHPDEKQRQQLSKQLGLSARQVKFWFQNRRTQIKAVQERHENSLLKSEIEKLQEENRAMRETIKKACCPHCGFTKLSKDAAMTTEEQQLRIENARLKAEIERLRRMQGSSPDGNTSPSSSCSAGTDQNKKSSLNSYSGFLDLEKSRIQQIVNVAMDELIKMSTTKEPLWVRSVETGREILNYDEYIKEFSSDISRNGGFRNIEASRETGVIFFDMSRLVQTFMDVNQWKELFPCLVSKAAIVDVISNGLGDSKDGMTQLMFAEIQMLTPSVSTRELYFVRSCKKLSPTRWAVLDVSVDKLEENIDISLSKFRKFPSGCILEDQDNGHCKVIWVEHMECQKCVVPTLYRSIVTNGLAFGARHWMPTLIQQCERLVFFMATNVPTRDCNGVSTLAGRKSILKLGQRMTSSFCQNISASGHHTWTKAPAKNGEEIRFTSRKNINDPGEPQGLIVCAVLSTWMPVPAVVLFDFLRDDSRRTEWDIMLIPGPIQTMVNLAKGQDRGNSVTIQTTTSTTERTNIWFLQDSSTNSYESIMVFAPVDIDGMQVVMTGCDSSSMAILPSGFSILPDGHESRPLVITSRAEERTMEGGSLLTIAFQILANSSPSAKLTMESVETATALVLCTLQNIKKALQCEDG